MVQIKIIFFALTSFFGIEDGRIAADKTTITVNPSNKEIVITQEELFTVIQEEKDNALVLDQWNRILNGKDKNVNWSEELDSFPNKSFDFIPKENAIQPQLKLKYSEETDLRAFGIWYNTEKNTFSINHAPQNNLKTNDGNQEGNYWVFNSDSTFSFTIEPFLQMPENYKKLKVPLKDFLKTIINE